MTEILTRRSSGMPIATREMVDGTPKEHDFED
jgi:hypothetical protein